MTFNIYNISKYSSFRDNNGEPLNSNKISGDIIKITNELKKIIKVIIYVLKTILNIYYLPI